MAHPDGAAVPRRLIATTDALVSNIHATRLAKHIRGERQAT